jgi:single-strand DNA-binding protein
MANDFNQVIVTGRLGKDPEVRRLNSGDSVANFSIACSETWRDKNSGERKEKTEWVNVSIFNDNLVKIAESYLKKGSRVLIQGKLKTRKWQDQSGNDKFMTEVVLDRFNGTLNMLDTRSDSDARGGRDDDRRDDDRGNRATGMSRDEALGGRGAPSSTGSLIDDDIPFAASVL